MDTLKVSEPSNNTLLDKQQTNNDSVSASDILSVSASDSMDKSEPHWSKLKRAAISRDTSDPPIPSKDTISEKTNNAVILASDSATENKGQQQRSKPNLSFIRRTKHYRYAN